MTEVSWNQLLLDQLEWHWVHQLRPRLDGLTDEEFLWEPVPGCWTVRQRGPEEFALDFQAPPPDPEPVTTIGWRLNHLLTVFAVRSADHFGRARVDYDTYPYAGTADDALAKLDGEHATWVAGVRALGEDGLLVECGPAEGAFAEAPLAMLLTHIRKEVIHHGAEVALLRDLYRAQPERVTNPVS